MVYKIRDSKVHGANMGPIWGRQDPGGPHVGPMNFAIRDPLKQFWIILKLDWEEACKIDTSKSFIRKKYIKTKNAPKIENDLQIYGNIWMETSYRDYLLQLTHICQVDCRISS